MAFIIFFLKKFEKIEKIEKLGYHSNFNFECNTEKGFKESLSLALGYFQYSKGREGLKSRQFWDDVGYEQTLSYVTGWTLPGLIMFIFSIVMLILSSFLNKLCMYTV